MAWQNKFNVDFSGRLLGTLSALALATAVLTGCNVGKSDTVATDGTTTTTTTSTTTSGAKSCAGSYVGNYGPPSHEERIRLRNLSLQGRGVAVTGNDDIDNANAGGGSPDGGIWMGGGGILGRSISANCDLADAAGCASHRREHSNGPCSAGSASAPPCRS